MNGLGSRFTSGGRERCQFGGLISRHSSGFALGGYLMLAIALLVETPEVQERESRPVQRR
jgi:hypothetical protein